MLSYYQILQVEKTATDAEIKQAYRSLGKILHPDLHNNSSEANSIFRLLQQAYETLSDPLKRKAYDIDPNPTSDNSTDARIESYREQNAKQARKLKEYEKMIKDYKQSLYLKDLRERELNKEVITLKERILESEKLVTDLRKEVEERDNRVEVIQKREWGFSLLNIILLIIGANVVLCLFYLSMSYAYGLFF